MRVLEYSRFGIPWVGICFPARFGIQDTAEYEPERPGAARSKQPWTARNRQEQSACLVALVDFHTKPRFNDWF